MSARLLAAPLILLLWQIVPMAPRRDAGGPVRLGFGAGGGDLAFRDIMTCSGPAYEPFRYTSLGGTSEVWVSDRVRLHAAGGRVEDATAERNGVFGAVQGVFEHPDFGLGLGVASFGGVSRSWSPAASFRLGSLDQVHFRADYGFPETTMGLTGFPRVGVAMNQGRARKLRVFAGATTTAIPDSKQRIGAFADIAIPAGPGAWNSGFLLRGFFGGINRSRAIWTLGGGLFIQP